MESKDIMMLRANLEYERSLARFQKSELAAKIEIHANTYRNREKNPFNFTLGELIKLQKALGAKSINEIFNLNEEGKINAK